MTVPWHWEPFAASQGHDATDPQRLQQAAPAEGDRLVYDTLFHRTGFDEIGVYYPIDAQRDVLERVAAEVMPSLRDR